VPNPEDFREGETLSAGKLNLLVKGLRRALKWDSTPTVRISEGADGFRADAEIPEAFAVFWTTSAISSASVSGTTASTATRTLGSGTARRCILNSSGHDIPDVNAADETIYNPVVMTSPSSINAAMFCECGLIGGKWRVLTVHKCPS